VAFVEITDIEKAQELCEAGLLWYNYGNGFGYYKEPDMRPWVPYNDPLDCPRYWEDGWKYYVLIED